MTTPNEPKSSPKEERVIEKLKQIFAKYPLHNWQQELGTVRGEVVFTHPLVGGLCLARQMSVRPTDMQTPRWEICVHGYCVIENDEPLPDLTAFLNGEFNQADKYLRAEYRMQVDAEKKAILHKFLSLPV